jgi:hypothetical protein
MYAVIHTSFSACKVSNCANCHSIVKDSEVDNSGDTYFASLQRGGLCLPSDFVIFIFFHMYAIFQYIISNSDLQKIKTLLC